VLAVTFNMSHISKFYKLNVNLFNGYATGFIIKSNLGEYISLS